MPSTRSKRRGNLVRDERRVAGTSNDAGMRFLNQAILLAQQGQFAQSETSAREALRHRPTDVDAVNALGAAVWRQGRPHEAETIFRQACALRPDDFRTLNNLGLALSEQGLFEQAGEYFRQSLRQYPRGFDARMNLGIVLSNQGKLDEAREWFLAAQDVRPDSIEILQNLAMNHVRQGRSPEAVGYYEEALRSQPDNVELHVHLAYALLSAGDFERGWREYEWRLKSEKHPGFRINRPIWNGEDIRNRTILLHTEQGFGDNLQFIRFAKLVKERAGFVVALCQTPLLSLIARCNGVDMAVDGSSYQPPYDVHAPLMSLPAILRTTLDSIPDQVPYLVTDKALVDHWGGELSKAIAATRGEEFLHDSHSSRAADGGPFRIGIAWQGNPSHSNDRWRSFPLSHFAPLAALPGVRLISLQTEYALDQLHTADRRFPVIELSGRRGGDFMETAAIMNHLDLIISPDTAIAHLAGGLGRRTWVGLCAVDEMRWLTGREDTPWYPTMRLFRQAKLGDWSGVFARMKKAWQADHLAVA